MTHKADHERSMKFPGQFLQLSESAAVLYTHVTAKTGRRDKTFIKPASAMGKKKLEYEQLKSHYISQIGQN